MGIIYPEVAHFQRVCRFNSLVNNMEDHWIGKFSPSFPSLDTTAREWESLAESLKELHEQMYKAASESVLRINRKEEPTPVTLSYLSGEQVESLGAFFASEPSAAQKRTLFKSIGEDAKEQGYLAALDLDLESVLSREDYDLWQNIMFWV